MVAIHPLPRPSPVEGEGGFTAMPTFPPKEMSEEL